MTLEPHHAAGRTRSWREDEAIEAWIAATGRGVPVTPPEGRSAACVDLRPLSGPVGPDPQAPIAGPCGGRGGDEQSEPVGRDTRTRTDAPSPTAEPDTEETP